MKSNIFCIFAIAKKKMALDFIDIDGIRRLDALLDRCTAVTVTAHTHPDGDALGSASAFVCYLRECREKDAVGVICNTPATTVRPIIPDGLPFLFHDTDPQACLDRIAASDLVILLDGNGFSRTEGLQSAFEASPAPKVLIDHHLNPERERFEVVFSTPDISSASELLYYVLLELPDIGGDARRLPAPAARALLTGMTTDTNNFANSVYPSTLEMSSKLLAAGVDRDGILSNLYQQYSENRIRAFAALLGQKMTILPGGVACMVSDENFQKEFPLAEGETEGLVNIPLGIGRVNMSIFVRWGGDHFRVSIRSKRGWSANRLARDYFHGGGHEMAAGGKILLPEDIPSQSGASAHVAACVAQFLQKEDNR